MGFFKRDRNSSSKKDRKSTSKEDQSKSDTQNQSGKPESPEVGDFSCFWEVYNVLVSHGKVRLPDLDSSYELVMLHVFGLDKTYKLELIAQNIGRFKNSGSTSQERKIARIIVDILNIRCSVISHPFWNCDGDGKRHKYKGQLEKDTKFLLEWFYCVCVCQDFTMTPETEESIDRCKEIMKKIAGKNWRDNNTPIFQEWIEFLKQKGVDLSQPPEVTEHGEL